MSKERLEEIKEYFGLWMKNDISRDWSLSSETIDNLKYLIEQAELAKEWQLVSNDRFNDWYIAEQQNKRYREWLEKIERNTSGEENLMARKALAGEDLGDYDG